MEFKLPKERKIDFKNWMVREIGGKITASAGLRGTNDFFSNYQKV